MALVFCLLALVLAYALFQWLLAAVRLVLAFVGLALLLAALAVFALLMGLHRVTSQVSE